VGKCVKRFLACGIRAEEVDIAFLHPNRCVSNVNPEISYIREPSTKELHINRLSGVDGCDPTEIRLD